MPNDFVLSSLIDTCCNRHPWTPHTNPQVAAPSDWVMMYITSPNRTKRWTVAFDYKANVKRQAQAPESKMSAHSSYRSFSPSADIEQIFFLISPLLCLQKRCSSIISYHASLTHMMFLPVEMFLEKVIYRQVEIQPKRKMGNTEFFFICGSTLVATGQNCRISSCVYGSFNTSMTLTSPA